MRGSRFTKRLTLLGGAALLGMAMAAPAMAQTDNDPITVSASVADAIEISIANPTVAFGTNLTFNGVGAGGQMTACENSTTPTTATIYLNTGTHPEVTVASTDAWTGTVASQSAVVPFPDGRVSVLSTESATNGNACPVAFGFLTAGTGEFAFDPFDAPPVGGDAWGFGQGDLPVETFHQRFQFKVSVDDPTNVDYGETLLYTASQ